MKTKAAVLRKFGSDYEIVELEIDPPRKGEVLVRMAYSGLCHSDEISRLGNFDVRLPAVLGHEGAGVVEAVGEGTHRLKPGDHVVVAFLAQCGQCSFCASGHGNLCDTGSNFAIGCLPDGSFRFHDGATDYGQITGTWSELVIVPEDAAVKVPDEMPLAAAALLACGVPTGYGSAVKAGEVKVGDTVVIYGAGGVGMNAVQGAALAGARSVIAVDPVLFKREKAIEFGATHVLARIDEVPALLDELTRGVNADVTIVTIDVVKPEHVRAAFDATRKGGTLVLTGHGNGDTIQLNGSTLTSWQKRVQGAIFGGLNPHLDIPRMAAMYMSGKLKLDELITQSYRLDQVNEGYRDLHDGKNIRGVIDFSLG